MALSEGQGKVVAQTDASDMLPGITQLVRLDEEAGQHELSKTAKWLNEWCCLVQQGRQV